MINSRHIVGLYVSVLFLASGAYAADSVGIPVCDDLLARFESCRRHFTPTEWSDYQKIFFSQIKGYAAFLAKDKTARAKVEEACKRHQEETKDLGGNMDCHMPPFRVFQSPFLFPEQAKTR